MNFWRKIKDVKSLFIILAFLSIVILFINTYFWQNVLVGVPWAICFLLILSIWLGEILGHFFNSGKEFKFIIGLFSTFYLIAFGLAVPIVFFRISLVYFYVFLACLTLGIFLLNRRFGQIRCESTNEMQMPRIASDPDTTTITPTTLTTTNTFTTFVF